MAAPVIHAVQKLLPKNICHIRQPGLDNDYVLSFTDVDQLQPADISSITTWLEQQISSLCLLAPTKVIVCPQIILPCVECSLRRFTRSLSGSGDSTDLFSFISVTLQLH